MSGDNDQSIDLNNSESENEPEDAYIKQEDPTGGSLEPAQAEISDPLRPEPDVAFR